MPSPHLREQGSPLLRWETVPCPLCQSSHEQELLVAPAEHDPAVYRLVLCRECGMGYLNPRPDENSITQLYTEEYEPYQAPPPRHAGRWQRMSRHLQALVLSHYYGYPPPLQGWRERLLARIAKPWFRPCPHSLTAVPFHGGGQLLDFGCGSGWYGQRMRERGWHVTGMDFSAHAARQVEQRFGFQVFFGTLPHPEVKADSFDMISMGAVLEHVHDPHRVIAAACRALRPGGRLLISVPNLASWAFRFFGRDWWGLDLPRHLLHFTPATLRRLVEGHGMEVRELATSVRAGWVRRSLAIAHRRGSPSSQRLLAKLCRVRVLASLMAHATCWTGQADSLRLIAERPSTAQERPGTNCPTSRAA